ncbi:hypothetical protein Taro_038369 [Colocasia esculenta]|uniref:Uncharacterized protein n=1 Tax=Colocasia esculenta TaxID=4460 RepID=A0A843WDQ3_COLES|nr:hypothetical protein [Colocasia esculenta]
MRGAAAVFPLSRPTAPSPPSPPALLQRAAASGAAAAARRSRPHLRSKLCGVACSCRQSGGDHGESPRRAPAAPQEVLLRAVAGAAISFSLFSYSLPSPPAAVALDAEATAAVQVPSPSAQARNCNAEEELDVASEASEPSVVANEDIVEEAWEIVNESFLDAGNHGWSPEKWLQKKMDIFRSTVPTRSRAHDIIKKMLASLGDPYTRFLTPAEMARYDMTGIGINLREVPDDSGAIRLKVLGIILDGPAQLAGIRQSDRGAGSDPVDPDPSRVGLQDPPDSMGV